MAGRFERVESWESRPVSGHDDIYQLGEEGFSGAVNAAGGWLFMLNGRVVGVVDGDLDAIVESGGTLYEAPHESLPLLFAMRDHEDAETRAKYYTNDTPLEEVDETLSESGFTGYVELSENVLSGDYYVVYSGGRSMSAAFVGASDTLLTDEEAFDRAAEEVGIYEVVKVPLSVEDVPEPEGYDAAAVGVVDAEPEPDESEGQHEDGDAATAEDDARTPAADDAATADEVSADEEDGPTEAVGTETTATTDEADDEPAADEKSAEDPASTASAAESPDVTVEPTDDDPATADADAPVGADDDPADAPTTGVDAADEASDDEAATDRRPPTDPPSETPASESQVTPGSEDDARGTASESGDERALDDRFEEEREWRETTSIPTLAPSEGEDDDPRTPRSSAATDPSSGSTESGTRAEQRQRLSAQEARQKVADLYAELMERTEALEERNEQLAAAREDLDAAEAERDELREERDALRETVSELESEIESLREDLREAQAEARTARATRTDTAGDGRRSLAPEEALGGTDLFVRYGSRGEPTLDDVGDGADPEAVNANLRLEHHTQFDANDVAVDGVDFESFLTGSGEYRFVEWAVRTLPYEIRDTGHQSGLADLFAAIGQVDRAEFHGTVDVESEEGDESYDFDVVLRDRMGTPLVVAATNARRDPVTGDMMTDLVEASYAVAERTDLAGAVYVTESFFEPGALEVTEEATGGGLLSRGSKESFVKTSRKRGYHLCLVESRGGSFYLNVPEL